MKSDMEVEHLNTLNTGEGSPGSSPAISDISDTNTV